MIGFIKGLLNSKPQVSDVTVQNGATQNSDAFFLDADDAKTFGNIDYMRSTKTIRRTFPKQKVGKENERIDRVSAMNQQSSMQDDTAAAIGRQPSEAEQAAAQRRSTDNSMDMFRNMARDLKKS